MTLFSFVSVFLSACPILGWSHYSLDRTFTSCSVEMQERYHQNHHHHHLCHYMAIMRRLFNFTLSTRTFNVLTYNATMFVFVLCLPFSFICYSNIKLVVKIKSFPKFQINLTNRILLRRVQERIQFERRLTTGAIYMISKCGRLIIRRDLIILHL
jgi:hypothetical protein